MHYLKHCYLVILLISIFRLSEEVEALTERLIEFERNNSRFLSISKDFDRFKDHTIGFLKH